MSVPTYETLLSDIAETVALRKILTAESEILSAVEDRERSTRSELSLTPEHVEAQANWRRFGEWFRGRMAARKRPKKRTPPPVVTTDPRHDHLGLYFVSLPSLDSA